MNDVVVYEISLSDIAITNHLPKWILISNIVNFIYLYMINFDRRDR